MSALKQARDDLTELLTSQLADVQVHAIIPKDAVAPLIAVGPGFPYIERAAEDAAIAYGEVLVRHQLTLIVETGDNDTQADALDDLIVRVLGIDLGDFTVQQVDEPGPAPINGQLSLGVNVQLASALRL